MPTAQGGPPVLILYAIIFVIFYFVLIRPQNAEKKKKKEQIENLKKNDQVVTAGGIHGTVANVKEKTVVVRIDDNVRIEFDKESISTVVKANK